MVPRWFLVLVASFCFHPSKAVHDELELNSRILDVMLVEAPAAATTGFLETHLDSKEVIVSAASGAAATRQEATARMAMRAEADVASNGVLDVAQDIFVKHGPTALLVGHIASTVVPNPVLLTVSLLKQVRNSYINSGQVDINGDLFRRVTELTSPRNCSSEENCGEHEACLTVNANADEKFCRSKTVTSEAVLLEQHELFTALRRKCVGSADVQEVMEEVKRLGDEAPRVEDLRNVESNECREERQHLKSVLKQLHHRVAMYEGGTVRSEYYKDQFYYLGDAHMDFDGRSECTSHVDCGKYQFCCSHDECGKNKCVALTACKASQAAGGVCPKARPQPPKDVLCEDGRLQDGCCWSSCNAIRAMRTCPIPGTIRPRDSPDGVSVLSGVGCRNLLHNYRSECCQGEARLVQGNVGGIGPDGSSHYCCPGGSCKSPSTSSSEREQVRYPVDPVENKMANVFVAKLRDKVFVRKLHADVANQTADPDFQVLSPPPAEPDSMWQMLTRRIAVVDVLLHRLEKQCPTSLPALFGQRTGDGAWSNEVLDAAEVARCTEGGFYLKEAMGRWAASKIMSHVLPIQASWANHACPPLLAKAKDLLQKSKANGIVTKLQVLAVYRRWQTECQPWADTTLRDQLGGETLEWVADAAGLERFAVRKTTEECATCANEGCCLISSVSKGNVTKMAYAATAADLAMSWVFDKGSLDVVLGGVQVAGVGAWVEAGAWLAHRGQEVFQNSATLNGDNIQSFCIAAAFHLEGLDRDIPK